MYFWGKFQEFPLGHRRQSKISLAWNMKGLLKQRCLNNLRGWWMALAIANHLLNWAQWPTHFHFYLMLTDTYSCLICSLHCFFFQGSIWRNNGEKETQRRDVPSADPFLIFPEQLGLGRGKARKKIHPIPDGWQEPRHFDQAHWQEAGKELWSSQDSNQHFDKGFGCPK